MPTRKRKTPHLNASETISAFALALRVFLKLEYYTYQDEKEEHPEWYNGRSTPDRETALEDQIYDAETAIYHATRSTYELTEQDEQFMADPDLYNRFAHRLASKKDHTPATHTIHRDEKHMLDQQAQAELRRVMRNDPFAKQGKRKKTRPFQPKKAS